MNMTVFFLVSRGADLELKNKDGWTAFHIAARTGDHQLIAYLADISPAAWNTVSRELTNCFQNVITKTFQQYFFILDPDQRI